MKLYALHVTTDVITPGMHVGYLALDAASGGYPFNKGSQPEFFTSTREVNHELKDILNNENGLGDFTDGGRYVRGTTGSFLGNFRKLTNWQRYDGIRLIFESLEFDFTDPLNIKTKVLRKVVVSAREAMNYKTRDEAFYNAEEIDLN